MQRIFRSSGVRSLLAAFVLAVAGLLPAAPASAQKDVRPAGIWYGIPDARPKEKGALRLATYNVENLFDPFDDPTLQGEYDDIDETTREVRVRAIAERIRELDADVLCLEEVESEACLRWFRDTYLKDMGYEHLASRDVGYYRGVEQSVLSRVPIERVSIFEGDDAVISDMEARRTPEAAKRVNGSWSKPQDGAPPERFQRSPLRVDLRTEEGYALTVFVVHFEEGRFDHQRELEALQVEEFVGGILKENPDANVAVLGDYNATPNQMAVKSLRMSPLGLVSAYDWRFDRKAGFDTYNTHASGRAIDFIVMSPGLAADCVDGSYFVLGTLHAPSDWDFRKSDEIPPPDGYASDHCPVAIDFRPSPDRPAPDRPAPDRPAPASAQKDVRPAGIWYGIPDARPKEKGALRLATYNVENLFDPFDDPTLQGEYDDIDETTREVRVRAIAEQIRKLDADVLCLEEVESEACLRWFRDNYLKDMGYEHLASRDVGYYRGVEQSVLSRVPIERVSIFEGADAVISDMEARRTPEAAQRVNGTWSKPQDGAPPERFQRSPLRVDLRTEDGYALTVFVVHFKAGRFDHQRELEALQVEAFVGEMLEANPDANVAVLGDYNATPNQMAVKSLRMSPLGLVSAYDWRFDRKAGFDTYNTHASGRAIDFIVMSPGLAADCVDGSYFVLGTLHAPSDWDFRKADEIPPPDGYASDHCPVAIDFRPSPDRPASAFARKPAESDETEAPRRPQPRSDATPPTDAEIAEHAKPTGSPDRKDQALAKRLVDAGWEFVLPTPKSETAKWSLKGGISTWWPGFWWNARSGATSRAMPEEQRGAKQGFEGDGKPVPSTKDDWKSGGAPDRVSWVEWLCSEAGRAK